MMQAPRTQTDHESVPGPYGDVVELSQGRVHYCVHGESGPWVILVHGLVTPMFAWEQLAETLAGAGFRVLRYDHFGRGFSDYPNIAYTPSLYVRQLEELWAALKLEGPAHLIGWSMGGVITANFASRRPEDVARMVLLAPGLFMKPPLWARLFMRTPAFPWIMRKRGQALVTRTLRGHFSRPGQFEAYRAHLQAQLENPAFVPSLVSTIKHFPFNAGAELSEVGSHPRPILLVWGDTDTTVPYANHHKVQALFPQCELMTVEGAGHAVHYEYPELVNPRVLGFLNQSGH